MAPASPATGAQELVGSGAELITVLDRVPTGRLVILGEPGSGKTVLLIRLVLDLQRRRRTGEPVPLLIQLASWNPDKFDLYSWLEAQIILGYPWLTGTTAAGVTWARALLTAGLILPVLDGLDEIRAEGRHEALLAINETLRPGTGLIISCRPEPFRHAIRSDPSGQPVFVEGAAGVRLNPLDATAASNYLTETAGVNRQSEWIPVRAALATTPPPPVARAFSTPLMVNLARVIYNPHPRGSIAGLPRPADLCDLVEFPTRAAIEKHLLDGLIPAAYRPLSDRRNHWTAVQAEPYLSFLAEWLEYQRRTRSLAWWELHQATPRIFLNITGGILFGVTGGIVGGLAGSLTGGLTEILSGILAGAFAGGFLGGTSYGSRDAYVIPFRISLNRLQLSDLGLGLAVGIGLGFFLAVIFGLAGGIVGGLLVGLIVGHLLGVAGSASSGFIGGLAGGVAFACTQGLLLLFSGTVTSGIVLAIDIPRAVSPKSVLAQDRASVIASGLATGICSGVVSGVGVSLAASLWIGFEVGFSVALTVWLLDWFVSTWGRFSLTRLWLAARGKLPIRLMAFLEDAHARGVLRQAGAVWEFRHANLQRRLANRP